MYTLKIPSAEFAVAALNASAKAGYLGAILILARRLAPEVEAELRDWWADIDDLTGRDLLVLVTGLKTRGQKNLIRSYKHKRDIFAEGIKMRRAHKDGFEEHFEDLLKVATPTPETPWDEATKTRLISAQGVNDIRLNLGIYEGELPALFLRANKEKRDFLICLGTEGDTFSPVRIIHEIAKALEFSPSEQRTILSDATKSALTKLGFVCADSPTQSNRATYCRTSIRARIDANQDEAFDLFLSHSSHEKATVRAIAEQLKSSGIKVWYDEWQLALGQPWQPLLEQGLKASKAIAVFIGKDGLGPWQNEEMQAALMKAVKTKQPVIPILLSGAPPKPDLPAFLEIRTWLDLRRGLTNESVKRLKLAIEGSVGTSE
jgi:hypothetical protein